MAWMWGEGQEVSRVTSDAPWLHDDPPREMAKGRGHSCGEASANAFSLGRRSLRAGWLTAGRGSQTPRVMPGPKRRVFPDRNLFSLQAVWIGRSFNDLPPAPPFKVGQS